MISNLAKKKALELSEAQFQERHLRKPRSFLSVLDLCPSEMRAVIQNGIAMKQSPNDFKSVMSGLSVALLFQKTSTRTRCSFENAAVELGAFPAYIDWKTSNFVLADLRDEVIVLSRFYDLIAARVLKHETLVTMAAYSEAPVINGMCDKMHPCQALGDYMTMTEYFGKRLEGLHLTYIGDGNNVCRSLVHGAINLGVKVTVCSPSGYRLDPETLDCGGPLVTCVEHPEDAVHDADVIYTDTWVSIGDEAQTATRLEAFKKYQINQALFALAPKHALFMHCLPAHPGQEVAPEVLRGPRSIVFDQAENRKHAQKAILEKLVTANAIGSSLAEMNVEEGRKTTNGCLTTRG